MDRKVVSIEELNGVIDDANAQYEEIMYTIAYKLLIMDRPLKIGVLVEKQYFNTIIDLIERSLSFKKIKYSCSFCECYNDKVQIYFFEDRNTARGFRFDLVFTIGRVNEKELTYIAAQSRLVLNRIKPEKFIHWLENKVVFNKNTETWTEPECCDSYRAIGGEDRVDK